MSKKKKGPAPGTLYKNVKRTSLGMKIAALRRERGLTQQALANKADLTKRMISYYERESETIPSNHMQGIASALGVAVDALINHTPSHAVLEVNRGFLRRLETSKTLPAKDQKIISDMIDSLATKAPKVK
jgi:transcriptional regulator with XRE-family HTH domain